MAAMPTVIGDELVLNHFIRIYGGYVTIFTIVIINRPPHEI